MRSSAECGVRSEMKQHANNQDMEPLLVRTKAFAVRVIRLTESPPRGRAGDVIGTARSFANGSPDAEAGEQE